MDILKLNSFLKLGYFIDYRNNAYQLDYSQIDRSKYRGCSVDELIDIGISCFKESINSEFETDQKHVVPLSGGMDSRAILAALLEHTSAENISTYTFGTPGTLDFEIGNKVATQAGTKHTSFALTDHHYTLDEMLAVSKSVDHQTVLFHNPPLNELKNRYRDSLFWSGYIGDAITGGHFHNNHTDILDAKKEYLHHFAYTKSINLINCDENDFLDHINYNWLDNKILSFEEQILYQERIQKLTAPHVLMKGFQYKTPFINNEFMDFMFSIDNKYRNEQYLYKKMLLKAFPGLFSIPLKNNLGLSASASDFKIMFQKAIRKSKKIANRFLPHFPDTEINYLDFNHSIREKRDFKTIIHGNISDLKKRGLIDWIDIESIWEKHINRRANHADALLVLASLEIHLKAEEQN